MLEYDTSPYLTIRSVTMNADCNSVCSQVLDILKCASQTGLTMIVATDDHSAQHLSGRLRESGVWTYPLTEPKHAVDHSIYVTPVTTMLFLVKHIELVKFASTVVNFDHHAKQRNFLARLLRYRCPKSADQTAHIYDIVTAMQ